MEELIFKEALAWKQKMRVRWAKEWDSNTKLFHGLVGKRRNKNSICGLERDDGSTVENVKEN